MIIEQTLMSSFIQRAEQKQSEIVSAAESLFLQQGYGATSMDQIAEAASVTKQTVYRYFPSKDELFAAVMSHIQTAESKPYGFSNGSVAQELTGYGNYLLSFHLQPKALGLYRLMLTEGAREDLFKTFKNAGPQRVLQPLITFFEQRCQIEDPAFCAQMFANMILAPRNQLLMSATSKMKKSDQKEHVLKVARLFLKIIE
jgi:TetR/AcrR family transcriptional repressor of mexJK operon